MHQSFGTRTQKNKLHKLKGFNTNSSSISQGNLLTSIVKTLAITNTSNNISTWILFLSEESLLTQSLLSDHSTITLIRKRSFTCSVFISQRASRTDVGKHSIANRLMTTFNKFCNDYDLLTLSPSNQQIVNLVRTKTADT